MMPPPTQVIEWVIHQLQEGSTDVSYALFNLFGVPVLRHGFILALPSVTIEVAEECSGIRSSIALLITCLLAAHMYLRSYWRTAFFMLLVVPLVVIKNGIRIVTLTMLSIYVDPSFLTGRLHHEGGVVFFVIALLLMFPVLLALEKSERSRSLAKSSGVPQTASTI
jgi:exosortase